MFIFSYFFKALAVVVDLGLSIYLWIIVAQALLSWVNPDPYNPIVRTIRRATEPVLEPIRSRIPVAFGGIDFSPILVILIIYFLKSFLVGSLYHIAGLFV